MSRCRVHNIYALHVPVLLPAQIDAKAQAAEEQANIDDVEEGRKRAVQEQREKAHLRHKHALQKEDLKHVGSLTRLERDYMDKVPANLILESRCVCVCVCVVFVWVAELFRLIDL